MERDISLKGCFPPIPTAFDSQGRVDHDQLSRNIERWQRAPLAGFVVLACIAADLVVGIMTDFEKGDLTPAQEVQSRLIPVNAAVTTRFGIPGLKAALDLMGMYGGPVRSPLLPLDRSDRELLERILRDGGVLETRESV
jgi:dihydrodipicolinate synthase/N-acetylneuraminate lyase